MARAEVAAALGEHGRNLGRERGHLGRDPLDANRGSGLKTAKLGRQLGLTLFADVLHNRSLAELGDGTIGNLQL